MLKKFILERKKRNIQNLTMLLSSPTKVTPSHLRSPVFSPLKKSALKAKQAIKKYDVSYESPRPSKQGKPQLHASPQKVKREIVFENEAKLDQIKTKLKACYAIFGSKKTNPLGGDGCGGDSINGEIRKSCMSKVVSSMEVC